MIALGLDYSPALSFLRRRTPATLLPNRHRAQGQSLGSFTHWIFAALLILFFPSMLTAFDPSVVFERKIRRHDKNVDRCNVGSGRSSRLLR